MRLAIIILVNLILVASCASSSRGTVEQVLKFGYRTEAPEALSLDGEIAKVKVVDGLTILRTAIAEDNPPALQKTKTNRLEKSDPRAEYSRLITYIDINIDASKKKKIRNTFYSQLVDASEQNCELYFENLRGSQVGGRLVSDLFSTGFGLAGGLASPIESSRILSALSGMSTATGASIDRNVFANQGVELIIAEIRNTRGKTRKSIERKLLKPYMTYPIGQMTADFNLFHGQCNLLTGLISLRDAVIKREAAVNVVRAATLRSLPTTNSKELKAIIEGIYEGFEESVGIDNKASKDAEFTAAIIESADLTEASQELISCLTKSETINAAVSNSSNVDAGSGRTKKFAAELKSQCLIRNSFIEAESTKIENKLGSSDDGIATELDAFIQADAADKEPNLKALADKIRSISTADLTGAVSSQAEKRKAAIKVMISLAEDGTKSDAIIGAVRGSIGTADGEKPKDPFLSLLLTSFETSTSVGYNTKQAAEVALAAARAILTTDKDSPEP